jgi:hypothetical protein
MNLIHRLCQTWVAVVVKRRGGRSRALVPEPLEDHADKAEAANQPTGFRTALLDARINQG